MRSIQRFGTAVVLAAVMAGGLGVTGVEAKGKKPTDGNAAICEYLWYVITYPNVNETTLAYALSLYSRYECSAQ